MNQRLQRMLCCPACAGDLVLRSFDGAGAGAEGLQAGTTKNGALCCAACSTWYPVMDYIPVMLTFTTPVHAKFAARHAAFMGGLAGYSTPQGQPMPGERSVQQTFSEEWDLIQENELSFCFTADELVELNRQVWLRALQKTRDEFKTVLNIGVGIAQETIALQKAIGNAEIVGVDLNFALLQRGEITESIPNLHLVIASLFRLPFRPRELRRGVQPGSDPPYLLDQGGVRGYFEVHAVRRPSVHLGLLARLALDCKGGSRDLCCGASWASKRCCVRSSAVRRRRCARSSSGR